MVLTIAITFVFFFLIWHINQEKKNLNFLINIKHSELKKQIDQLQEKQREVIRLKTQFDETKKTVALQKREIMILENRLKLFEGKLKGQNFRQPED